MHLPTWRAALDATCSAMTTLGLHAARTGRGFYTRPDRAVSFAVPPRWAR